MLGLLSQNHFKHISNICEKNFLITLLKLDESLTIITSLNQVKPRFSKFTLKNSWLENYSVKAWLKSLKITKSWFYSV